MVLLLDTRSQKSIATGNAEKQVSFARQLFTVVVKRDYRECAGAVRPVVSSLLSVSSVANRIL
jgi:hypothetical protein